MAAFRMVGASVRAIGPPTLLPARGEEGLDAEMSTEIGDVADADLVYVLRMQTERMGPGGFVPTLREYAREYGIGRNRLRPGQRVMHAGPVNRGVEISDEIVDDQDTLILQQAANGQLVRMAVLYDLLAAPEPARADDTMAAA
jgi:aspartate carbamoyltransferase catalytic subunit